MSVMSRIIIKPDNRLGFRGQELQATEDENKHISFISFSVSFKSSSHSGKGGFLGFYIFCSKLNFFNGKTEMIGSSITGEINISIF